MNADALLSRLARVRETGHGRWLACCPAHDDRSPSLSIRELPDGRILLHDFAGCETGDVLAAIGLTVADLFPDAVPVHRARPSSSRIAADDLLLLIDSEVAVIVLAAAHIIEHKTLTEPDWQRIAEAHHRISHSAAEIRK